MPIKKLLEHNAFRIAIFLTIFIAFVSLVSFKGVHIIKVSNSDKYGHFFAYLCLSFSWLFVFRNHPKKKYKKYLIVFILISYGIIIEVLQNVLTAHRQADLYDIIANSVGVLLAAILFDKIMRIF